jgi:hypothetical protein
VRYQLRRVLLGALALSATTAVLTTGSAFASEPPGGIVWDHVYKTTGVTVYVEEHGDWVSLCDSAANGSGAYVVVQDRVEQSYRLEVKSYGSCMTRSAADGYQFDLHEGDTIGLEMDGDGSGPGHKYVTFVNDH